MSSRTNEQLIRQGYVVYQTRKTQDIEAGATDFYYKGRWKADMVVLFIDTGV
jgi:hypothetical protein